jgi:antirestriction protein
VYHILFFTMDTQTTATKPITELPIGLGISDDYPCICIQDYETSFFQWFNLYEIFQASDWDYEEFKHLMERARKSVLKSASSEEWFYPDCQYLHSIYSEHIDDYELFQYMESLEQAINDGHSVSLHEEFIGHFGNSYFGDLSEYYYGEFESTKEFCEQYVESTIDLDSIPDVITSNINYENMWYDLQHDFVEIEADQTTYFFINR